MLVVCADRHGVQEEQDKPIEHPLEPLPIENKKEFTSLFFDFKMQRGKHRNFSLWERLSKRNRIVECGVFRVRFSILFVIPLSVCNFIFSLYGVCTLRRVLFGF